MKKLLIIITCIISLTGCFQKDTMEDINIYTTTYPITFITERLYGEYSNIKSIYPNGVNVQLKDCKDDCTKLYTLTEKQLTDYSESDLFVFNSLLYEGSYVKPMFENNKNLKIINANDNWTSDEFYGLEEIWLDPSRLLTVARNIKNGFGEYIDNYYLNQSIENNFQTLKEELDKLGSKLADTTKNATNKIIVVGSDTLKFLSKNKYGLTVYSLEESDNLNEKTISDVKELIKNKTIKHIYIMQYDEVNETINNLIKDTGVEIVRLHTLVNLTETEISNKKDYFSIMNENIDLIKRSLYN